MEEVKRGSVYWVDLGNGIGSLQGGIRPVVVTSNNVCNRFSPIVEIRPITTKINKRNMPTHVLLLADKYPLKQDSIVLVEQAMSINKSQLMNYICSIDDRDIVKINVAIAIQSGLVAHGGITASMRQMAVC